MHVNVQAHLKLLSASPSWTKINLKNRAELGRSYPLSPISAPPCTARQKKSTLHLTTGFILFLSLSSGILPLPLSVPLNLTAKVTVLLHFSLLSSAFGTIWLRPSHRSSSGRSVRPFARSLAHQCHRVATMEDAAKGTGNSQILMTGRRVGEVLHWRLSGHLRNICHLTQNGKYYFPHLYSYLYPLYIRRHKD